jgi:NAD(P)-dependent dehydrogenase (short-subunit alcohol dehydrogenase family)
MKTGPWAILTDPHWENKVSQHNQERVAVITGASAGIGLVTAKALAAAGWRIIALGRDPARCAVAEAAIRAAAGPGGRVDMIRADLSLLSEADRAAQDVAALTDRIDALLNNAGGTSNAQRMTAEGNESTFASNHLGHFLFTDRVLPLLRAAAADAAPGATRIINVSSSAHEYTPGIDWNDIQSVSDFQPMRAYMNAKLANVLFTRALAKRLTDSGIVVHAMHPGAVDTNFYNYADDATQEYAKTNGLISAEDGADTLIWMVTAPDVGETSGKYYHLRQAVAPSAPAQDEQAAERLWLESEKLISI